MFFYVGPVLAFTVLAYALWVIAKMIRVYRGGDEARKAYKEEVESRRRSRKTSGCYPPFGGNSGD